MLSEEEQALRKRAGRLLESLRRIPDVLRDRKAWENEHELVFSLFRRGTIDGANNGMLEAPIYNNRQIENAWLFLLEMRHRHPNRQKQVQECAGVLGGSYNWSMVLHGSRKFLAALCEMPQDLAKEVLDAAQAPEVLERMHAAAAVGIGGVGLAGQNDAAAGSRPAGAGSPWPAPSEAPGCAVPDTPALQQQAQPDQQGLTPARRPKPTAGRLNPFVDPPVATKSSSRREVSPRFVSEQHGRAERPAPWPGGSTGGDNASPHRLGHEQPGWAECPRPWHSGSAGAHSAGNSPLRPAHMSGGSGATAGGRPHNPHNPFNSKPPPPPSDKSQSHPSSPRRSGGNMAASGAMPGVGRSTERNSGHRRALSGADWFGGGVDAGQEPGARCGAGGGQHNGHRRMLSGPDAWSVAPQGYGGGFHPTGFAPEPARGVACGTSWAS